MSLKKVALKICFSLTGIIGVAYVTHEFVLPPSQLANADQPKYGRGIASVGSMAGSGVGNKSYLAMGKPNRTLSISLDPVPQESNSLLKLGATIKINQKVDSSIQMEWELPEGVSLVTGEKDFWIHSLSPGESYYAEVELAGMTPEKGPKVVSLSGEVQIGAAKIGGEAVYSTHIQQKDLSIRQKAPGALGGVLKRKAASATREGHPIIHF